MFESVCAAIGHANALKNRSQEIKRTSIVSKEDLSDSVNSGNGKAVAERCNCKTYQEEKL